MKIRFGARSVLFTSVFSLLAGFGAVNAVHASGLDSLKPHRAVYDLRMVKSSSRSGISGMNGRIVYELTGNKCEGFSTRFRFLTTVQTSRKTFTNDQRTTSYESGDGTSFNFVTQSYLNGQLEKEVRGAAEKAGSSIDVKLTKPDERDVSIGGGVFMNEHIGKIIEAGRKGETILTTNVYDGSDDGDALFETTAIVGKAKDNTGALKGESADVAKQFEGKSAWPVSVSYFKEGEQEGVGEKLPVYQVSFLLHESGVSRRLKMQYEDYSLEGTMQQIEFLDAGDCKP